MPARQLSASSSTLAGEIRTALALAAAMAFFVITGVIAYNNVRTLQHNSGEVVHTASVLLVLDDLLSATQDAETGQRGFLLTGSERYLEPYNNAVTLAATNLEKVTALTQDNDTQQANLVPLRRHITAKLAELERTVVLRRTNGFDAALAIVSTDQGKAEMDAIRAQIDVMRGEELRLRGERLEEMESAFNTALAGGVMSAVIGLSLTLAVFLLLRRASRVRLHQQWLQAGQVGLSNAMMGDKSIEQLGDDILTFLAQYLDFQAGALFKGESGRFNRAAALGVSAEANVPTAFTAREGLLGRVADEGKSMVLNDVPEGYLTIGSALGQDKPRHLLIVPAHADGIVNAVLELGFLHSVRPGVLEFLEQAGGAIGVALRSARFRSRLQEALEETQRQSEELQVQSEELRVSNEELDEQTKALKESQVRLEQQQAELEQTNSQLEEQAQTLEHQRDEIEKASAAVSLKARELEQASQYKSDFLANMSHELRTPLNSLLILSKLLSDNGEGNLNPDQVKYARTIQSSGNDLLTLINDILDLSKIEAGHLQMQPETLPLQRLANDLRSTFQPIADDRGLAFEIEIAASSPPAIETDRQRIEQVLKNLLSNAFKFTESGAIRLIVAPNGKDQLALAVTDTGIGISPEQQQGIFEAFRQADGTISRRYGGTGLGLSISRELTRLLGGTISLESSLGDGSTFTVTLPIAYDPAEVAPREVPVSQAVPEAAVAPLAATPAKRKRNAVQQRVEDDRDARNDTRRLLLVVEDDNRFAAIVRDLSNEMGFRCIVAATAEEALNLARQFKPSAIVLDVGLPDQSGLTVLDRLKHDPQTRHIPIHVVSGTDHSQTAMALGAVGYLMKPVKREAVADVLRSLETKLDTRMRRVLIVEDDDVQRDAVSRLLATSEVETVGVGTAADCLAALSDSTFDCMVLDLTLPDASGYSLLETLSGGDHAFPPVIVYTGHDLSPDEEQRLRRYSHSIIIKGAKSPERLLDEVSLFLHQVVSDLPPEQQKMIQQARNRDAALEGRRILVVEDDIRNVYSLTSVLEPRGAVIQIARNGKEAMDALDNAANGAAPTVDLVLMDVMMPVMDGLTATQALRRDDRFGKLPIIMLTAKAMPDDQQRCLDAGANDYMAKPIDVDKLLSLVRVWMPR
jgi:signal transduction histidine kinase/DNA-binding response OmpR family regulator/CHASE3 domain sensor protein